MGLTMASPYKHPKTGMYWFRRRVPKDLRPILGDKTINVSLKTKDVAKAKRRFIEVSAKFEREWDRLRAKMAKNALEPPPLPEEPDPLSRWQMYGLAGQFARWFVAKRRDEPGRPADWQDEVDRDKRWARPAGPRPPGIVSLYVEPAKQFLAESGIAIRESDLWDLTWAVSKAGIEAKETMVRMARNDFSKNPRLDKYPEFSEVVPGQDADARRALRGLRQEQGRVDEEVPVVPCRPVAVPEDPRPVQGLMNPLIFPDSKTPDFEIPRSC